jgi:hypothetical protein
VRINSAISEDRPLTAGVPQGSILGPLLFNLFVADLSWSCHAKLIRYADDTNIIISCNNYTDLKREAEEHFTKVVKWFKTNYFVINPSKTQMILLCGSSRAKKLERDHFFINYGSATIRPSDTIKILGYTIDQDFNLLKQTNQVVKKISFSTRLSLYVSKFVDSNTKLCLLATYIMPHADYCGVITSCNNKKHTRQTEKALQRSGKQLHITKDDTCSIITKMKLRWIIRAMSIFFEIMHSSLQSLTSHGLELTNSQSTRSCMPAQD